MVYNISITINYNVQHAHSLQTIIYIYLHINGPVSKPRNFILLNVQERQTTPHGRFTF